MITKFYQNQEINNESQLHNDFRSEVKGGWHNVYAPIQKRMDHLLVSSEPTTFIGTGFVERSKIGYIFVQLARLLGAPLVWSEDKNVITTVTVAPTKNNLRCWHRHFKFSDGSEQLIQTTKIVDPQLGFMDAVGKEGEKRLATQMSVWSEGKSLYFKSSVYWLRFKYFKIKIPLLLTPGTLFAEHRDEGHGYFRYILSFTHPLWGETFYQDGIFKMIESNVKAE